ncbi:MAG: alpha/beta hydrolase [Candidatus Saccharibacteria bacterium]|nr:alpha/beta hydrolase [Candidatus Saccharibacteria bacterium]
MAKLTSKDGTTIAYDKKGQGPLLILILGALNRRSQGKKLTELLAGSFTVVSYDRRGRGDSTDTLPYSTEKEVEDIEALINELGGSAYLYGHSSGCVLALMAAKKMSDKVKALALYELPYDADPSAQEISKAYRKELAQLLSQDKRGDAIALFVKSVGVSDKQIAAMERLPMWKGLTAMAHTLAYDTIELMEQYPTTDIKDITTKTLIMYGTASPSFMDDTAQKLSEVMTNATIHPLEGQVHDVKADVLAPVLAEFFA